MGDAYVLLANAYSLLDSQVPTTSNVPFKYLRLSASILQHWHTTPLRQYPFTKNRQNAETLLKEVMKQLAVIENKTVNELVEIVRARKDRDLSEALSPATFDMIREQLNMQPL
jgi:hypothetical protein